MEPDSDDLVVGGNNPVKIIEINYTWLQCPTCRLVYDLKIESK